MILENRPGLLVELHMLKDYKTRVTGNYEILRALLEVMNRDASKLMALNREADEDAAKLGAHALGNERFPLAIEWGGGDNARGVSRLPVQARAERSFGDDVGELFP